jgi:hypothetical protein
MCNTHLASQAIPADPEMSVPLACYVQIAGPDGAVRGLAQDPRLMSEAGGSGVLSPAVEDARKHIVTALDSLTPS